MYFKNFSKNSSVFHVNEIFFNVASYQKALLYNFVCFRYN